jgi:hypothetical protein
MSEFELRLAASPAQLPASRQVTWPAPGRTGTLVFNLDPGLSNFGAVPDRAIDLVRMALGVFAADQLVKRAETFTRSLDLRVQVLDPTPFDEATLAAVADLLRSLSGDDWTIGVMADPVPRAPATVPVPDMPAAARVALLSGGLDSFAGAVLSSQLSGRTAYLGYWHQAPERGAREVGYSARRFLYIRADVEATRLPDICSQSRACQRAFSASLQRESCR